MGLWEASSGTRRLLLREGTGDTEESVSDEELLVLVVSVSSSDKGGRGKIGSDKRLGIAKVVLFVFECGTL